MIFTIDNDNDIRAHETEAQAEEAAKRWLAPSWSAARRN